MDGNELSVAVLKQSIIMGNFLVDPFRISILGTLLHIAPHCSTNWIFQTQELTNESQDVKHSYFCNCVYKSQLY